MPRFVKLLTLAQAIVFMLPLSIAWLFLVGGHVVQPAYGYLARGAVPPTATFLLALWLALAGVGLCALWELFLRHHRYTLASIPLRVKIGLAVGFAAAVPLSAKGGAGALLFFGVPLLLLVQFYFLIRMNGETR